MAEPAASKLRTVLDYVPCEACLAQPVDDQELLCSVCRRLDRQVGVRIAVRTTILLDRPSEPAPPTPVVIQPPPPAAPPAAGPPRVDVVFVPSGAAAPKLRAEGAPIEVLVTPLDLPQATPDPEADISDFATFEPPVTESFSYTGGPAPPRPRAAPAPEPAPPPPAEVPQDENVFTPPPRDETPEREREDEMVEDWMPDDEGQGEGQGKDELEAKGEGKEKKPRT